MSYLALDCTQMSTTRRGPRAAGVNVNIVCANMTEYDRDDVTNLHADTARPHSVHPHLVDPFKNANKTERCAT